MKNVMALLILLIFVGGCATSALIAGYTDSPSLSVPVSVKKEGIITENNVNLLDGKWVGQVKVTTVQSGILEYNASLDIKTGNKKVTLVIGRKDIFENCVFKNGYFFGERKKTGEWIEVTLIEGAKLKAEFEIKNKNPALSNIKGEGIFVPYQK